MPWVCEKMKLRIILFILISSWSINHYLTNMTFMAAHRAVQAKRYALGIRLLDKTIKRDPKFFKAYYIRGQLHLMNNDYESGYNDLIITDFLCPDFGNTRKLLKGII
jgi:hypothetical protein